MNELRPNTLLHRMKYETICIDYGHIYTQFPECIYFIHFLINN